jgi:hypothetical protein
LATSEVRNPYDFLVTNFTLLLRPSTAPEETTPRARNQFKINGRWTRIVRAIFFIGSSFERITSAVYSSRNFPAHIVRRSRVATPRAIRSAVLPGAYSNHKGGASGAFLQSRVGVDERLDLIDAIEDRPDTHPAALRDVMKRSKSILTERCPRMRNFLSRQSSLRLMHPEILRETSIPFRLPGD